MYKRGQVESSRKGGGGVYGGLMCRPLKDMLDSENLYVQFIAFSGKI